MNQKKTKPKTTSFKFAGSFYGVASDAIPIFTVTSVNSKFERRKCQGWYPTLREAKKAVRMNAGDLCEQEFIWAVIEKVPAGIPPIAQTIQWCVLDYNRKEYAKSKWYPCKPPEGTRNIVNWCF